MKRVLFLFLILGVCLVNAQEGMQAPEPLTDAFLKSYLGKWQGATKSEMGESEDVMDCWMALNDQFVIINYKSTSPAMNYEGMGAVTIDPQSGQVLGYWIDSMRDMSKGVGKIEGNKLIMEWTSKMGTGTRTEELVDNKLHVTSKWKMPDGSVMESTSDFQRVPTSE